MKRNFLSLCLTALLLLFGQSLFAHNFEADGIYYTYLSKTDKTVSVSYRGISSNAYSNEYSGNVVIPASVTYNGTTYSVTSIGGSAFNGCTGLTSIEIPSSVTSIGNDAFSGCSSLESIALPFVGDKPHTETGTYQYPFGYIFGTYSYAEGTATTQSYYGSSTSSKTSTTYYIPSSLKSVKITGSSYIPYGAFSGCSGLTSIEIPSSVTSIGQYAFEGCSGLTSIEIPSSVTSIGNYAFYKCTGLTNATIPSSVTSIGRCAFYRCSRLTSIEIPSSVTSIGRSAFYGCSGLTSIEIPSSVTSIGYQAFSFTAWYNKQPNGVVYAGKVAYTYKGTMPDNTSIVLIDGTLGIGDYAFSECTGLTSISIPNSVTSIGNYAFENCTGLTSVEIPSSVTSIGDYAFQSCKGLTSISIPSGVTSIGSCAFLGCTGLTSIEIPSSVTSIGNYAFDGTTWYNNQPNGVVYVGKVAYTYKGTMPDNTSIVLIDGTLGIGDYAFSECTGLTSIEIPSSVTSIGNYAFDGTTWYNNQPNGVVYAGKVAYTYKGTMPDNSSIVLIDGTLGIGDNAFQNCTGLTSIEIPSSVTSIGDSAFADCTGLTRIMVPSSVTCIGDNAFRGLNLIFYSGIATGSPWGATSIVTLIDGDFFYADIEKKQLVGYAGTDASVIIPSNVTTIGVQAFKDCTRLTSVTIPSSVTSIGSNAFSGCTGLTSVSVPSSMTSIGDNAFRGCTGLIKAEFASIENLCAIEFGSSANPLEYAHNLYIGEEEITDLVIPGDVTSIGKNAFNGCTKLNSVTIPSSVTSIGDNAFKDVKSVLCSAKATGLPWGALSANYGDSLFLYSNVDFTQIKSYVGNHNHIVVPTYVTSIGSNAFQNCTGLTSIEIPNSVTSIGSCAFEGCTGLTNVVIPNSITSIYNSTFSGCTGLTSITIPSSVTSIDNYAFKGCDNIEKLNYNTDAIGTIFSERTSLKAVYIGKDVTTIADNAFAGCTELKTITGGSGVTSIGSNAFLGCKRATEMYIGSKVEKIGDQAFNGCTLLRIYNYAEFPQDCGTDAFSIVKSKCTLYVKPESVDYYSVHKDWCDFNIQPMTEEMLAIESILCEDAPSAKTCFDLQGRKVTKPQRGQLYLQDGKKAIVW
ncbi:MAG: leucine-rich repeat domain-containing protein [Bacteroidales bacterium]|nr:leucine-rich repeat domain-containing protein [Bacteroidales bacterium]